MKKQWGDGKDGGVKCFPFYYYCLFSFWGTLQEGEVDIEGLGDE